ncbi:MAG TPA: DedA family protein [Chloroflexi bacterium]|nr:DedA family protein [Chloroflexota bacterium]
MIMRKLKQKAWLKLVLYFVILIGLSFGFLYLFRRLGLLQEEIAPTAYLAVFVLSMLNSALIGIPVPFALAVMIAVSSEANFILTVFIGSVGGTLGELAAYYAGYLGKRIIHLENTPGYARLVGWMERNGPWGIFLISFQPILPVDIAGFLAGVAKLSLWKFLLPCWAGKFPKYLLFCYIGEPILEGLWRILPLPHI